jgi:hypothetical protein
MNGIPNPDLLHDLGNSVPCDHFLILLFKLSFDRRHSNAREIIHLMDRQETDFLKGSIARFFKQVPHSQLDIHSALLPRHYAPTMDSPKYHVLYKRKPVVVEDKYTPE